LSLLPRAFFFSSLSIPSCAPFFFFLFFFSSFFFGGARVVYVLDTT